MRDFTLPWGLLLRLVKCLWTELPTASGPKSAQVYCGYRPAPVWPSTQVGWWRYRSASSCVRGLRGCGSGCTACIQWWTVCGAALSEFPHIDNRISSHFESNSEISSFRRTIVNRSAEFSTESLAPVIRKCS